MGHLLCSFNMMEVRPIGQSLGNICKQVRNFGIWQCPKKSAWNYGGETIGLTSPITCPMGPWGPMGPWSPMGTWHSIGPWGPMGHLLCSSNVMEVGPVGPIGKSFGVICKQLLFNLCSCNLSTQLLRTPATCPVSSRFKYVPSFCTLVQTSPSGFSSFFSNGSKGCLHVPFLSQL